MFQSGSYDVRQRAAISYAIRKIERHADRPLVTTDFARSVAAADRLPGLEEQIENVVLYLGQTLDEPGATVTLTASSMRATIGCVATSSAGWVLKQAHEQGLVQGIPRETSNTQYQLLNATLSVRGWEFYKHLLAGGSRTKRAFMAMKFGDVELDRVFVNYFKPACERAGFELVRLDEQPKAGLIDDRLRVEIRRSRFLVADLSDGNSGAYWEAGFAEGLGRPVIYTCRKNVFDDEARRPHFDTNHHLTVVWDPEHLEDAANSLATTIRVTLPGEAALDD